MRAFFFLVALSGLIGVPFSAQAELSRDAVKAIVREFLEDNPEVILNSITRYSVEQRMKSIAESIRPHTPTKGSPLAPVTIVEYGEYQCPFCEKAQPTLKELRKRYKNKVRFAFKHLPLEFHPKALPAAKAAQAAARQGKFWEYSAILWERQQYLGEKLLIEAAKELDLDMDKFNEDRKSESIAQEIQQDLIDGAEIGARGTPYFVINGQALSGAQPLENFVDVIESAFEEIDQLQKK